MEYGAAEELEEAGQSEDLKRPTRTRFNRNCNISIEKRVIYYVYTPSTPVRGRPHHVYLVYTLSTIDIKSISPTFWA